MITISNVSLTKANNWELADIAKSTEKNPTDLSNNLSKNDIIEEIALKVSNLLSNSKIIKTNSVSGNSHVSNEQDFTSAKNDLVASSSYLGRDVNIGDINLLSHDETIEKPSAQDNNIR